MNVDKIDPVLQSMASKGMPFIYTFVSEKCIRDFVDKSSVQTPHMKSGVIAPTVIEEVLSDCNRYIIRNPG